MVPQGSRSRKRIERKSRKNRPQNMWTMTRPESDETRAKQKGEAALRTIRRDQVKIRGGVQAIGKVPEKKRRNNLWRERVCLGNSYGGKRPTSH